ncbi:MAG: ATP-dependent RNA helicase HrpA [Fibrobacterota bacterium]|nr:MAG: ATP-dependent RNA helicase HrpA [Fibrobacterota bacterium]
MDFQPDLTLDGTLPIHSRAEEIEEILRANPVVILCGETGSGKSTQLPKLLLRAGFGQKRPIAITQPRRVAALSLARRVSEELKAEGTSFVGHKVRFDNRTDARTRVIFATDGTLLAELASDPLLRRYEAVVVDEAHERSLNVDFLIGVLRRIRMERPDFRIVIASATIDTEAFAKAFADKKGKPAPIISVEGRSWPVDVLYRDELAPEDEDESLPERVANACREMMGLSDGDLLCFLPGEKEIRDTARELDKALPKHTEVVPLFGRLSASDQDKVFHPGAKRRIILTTNVAETSVTVPRIRMVVDTGLARLSRYTPRTRTKRLQVEAISQASARQRAGRCGRIAPGICLRLYSREDFERREVQTAPEVQRADLSEVILRLLDLGLGQPEDFPFLDPPDKRQLADGWQLLRELEAVDDEGRISATGRKMARLPLDPRTSRILLEGAHERCIREAVILAAGLSIPDPRETPEGKEEAARAAQKVFQDRQSDFLTMINLWEACEKAMGGETSGNRLRKFCQAHYLSYMRMRDWREAVRQVGQMLETDPDLDPRQQKASADYGQIHRAILSGFLSNLCRLDEEAAARDARNKDQRRPQTPYRAARGRMVFPWPGSVLAKANATWIVSAEIVETSRTWARTAAEVDPAWVEAIAGDLVKREYGPAVWDEASQNTVCSMKLVLWGLVLFQGRRALAREHDPDAATLAFCREALVEGRLRGRFPFLEWNRELRERIEGLEERMRRRALAVGSDSEVAWYASRLPAGISGLGDLQGFLKREGESSLRMTESDLMTDDSQVPSDGDFPLRWKAGALDLPLSYRFAPEDDEDGITITIPEARLDAVPDAALEWLVPGHLAEKVESMLRGLSRENRQRLSPLPESARRFARDSATDTGRIALREALSTWMRTKGLNLPASAFPSEADQAPHLRFLVRIVDAKGNELGRGRSIADLRLALAERTAKLRREAAESALGAPLRGNLRDWPRDLVVGLSEEIRTSGMPVTLFPALSVREQTVELRRFPTRGEADLAHRKAVEKLLEWNVDGSDHLLAWLPRDLQIPSDLALPLAAWCEPKVFVQGLCDALRRHALEAGRTAVPRDLAVFAKALDLARVRIRQGRGEARTLVTALVQARRRFEEIARSIPGHRPDLLKFAELTRARLWPTGFPAVADWTLLKRLPTWWDTAGRRIKSSLENPKRDQERASQLAPYVQALAKRAGDRAPIPRSPGQLSDPDGLEILSELAFAMEEFRVQTWAQELGTSIPASAKRMTELFTQAGIEL